MLFSSLVTVFTAFALALPAVAFPFADRFLEKRIPALPVAVTTVHEFAFPSWCENLAVRANGQILVTRLDTPEVILVSPTNAFAPVTIATWNATAYKGALGITETNADIFEVVLSANVDEDFVKTSGVPAVYKINMNTFAYSGSTITSNATVSLTTEIPTADFLNGATTLDTIHVLVADAYNGWVYKVNTLTGAYSIAIDNALMKHPSGGPNLGVNGLKIRNSYLYWTNTGVGTVNKIKITSAGTASGASSVVATVSRPDDFIFKSNGAIFVPQNQLDELSYIAPGASTSTVIAGSSTSTLLAGVTSAQFGRLSSDSNRLYLATSGGKFLLLICDIVTKLIGHRSCGAD